MKLRINSLLFQDLLKKLKSNKHITEDALVLDPDLIDLTMIPPPMTPDEVSIENKSLCLSIPYRVTKYYVYIFGSTV